MLVCVREKVVVEGREEERSEWRRVVASRATQPACVSLFIICEALDWMKLIVLQCHILISMYALDVEARFSIYVGGPRRVCCVWLALPRLLAASPKAIFLLQHSHLSL